jgi:hypothetical protein
MIVMAAMVVLMWTASGYSYADRHAPGSFGPPWIFLSSLVLLFGLLLGAGYTVIRSESQSIGVTTGRDVKNAPRLQIDFAKTGLVHNLAFKSDKVTFVRKVRPLVSGERYRSEHEFTLIPSTLPRIDPGASVESRIYGLRQSGSSDIRSLLDILSGGSEGTVDSVIIDYDDDHGHRFSRRFDLTRNQDDTVAWIPEPMVHPLGEASIPDAEFKDLADLRHRVALAARFPEEEKAALQFGQRVEQEKQRLTRLRATLSGVLLAAKLNLLVETAERLSDQFNAILAANDSDSNPIDLSRPLIRELISLDSSDPIALPWQRLRLMSFRDRYSDHRIQVINRDLGEFSSPLVTTTLPTEMPAADVSKMLARHRTALAEKARMLAEPFFTTFDSDAIDPSVEVSKKLQEWQFPVPVAECPTELTLQFNTGNLLPELISTVNVWRWYALKTVYNFVPREGPPVTMSNWIVFVAFERPIVFEQIRIDPKGATIPMYEIKDRSARTFVAVFSGELAGIIGFQAS